MSIFGLLLEKRATFNICGQCYEHLYDHKYRLFYSQYESRVVNYDRRVLYKIDPWIDPWLFDKIVYFYRARWTFCQSGGVSGGLWHGHVAPLPRLHPRLRRHVQQDLAGAQASNEEQGRHVEGKRAKLIIIFTLYHVRMSQEL